MLSKFRTLAALYRQAGFRWSAFRVAYAIRLRTGLIRLQMPPYKWADRPLETWLKNGIPSTPEAYAQWRKQNSPKFFFDVRPVMLSRSPERSEAASEASLTTGVETHADRDHNPWSKQTTIDEANRILSGEIKYFGHEFHQTGFPPNWHKDYFTSHVTLSDSEGSSPQQTETLRSQRTLPESDTVVANRHWSQISDDGEVDIKFIWEASRFGMVYTLVRAYAWTKDERYAQAFWELVFDWAEHNPPNMGPNWMDGQEIALRLMAWTFGFHAFFDSPSTKPEYISQFTSMLAAQAERIYKNIDYAISTQSNHTISEGCGLWLVGILFPELKDAKKYLAKGRKLLEEAAARQIFPDGSYSMYSLNYHRFVLQIFFYAIRLGELNGSPLSETVKRVASKSIDYLYQLIDPQTGKMPVYGSNDGALVLPLNTCDFTDYRPLLQLGSFITKGKKIFESGAWDEDLYWLCGPQALRAEMDIPMQTDQSFSNGGVYVMHGPRSRTVIRCTDFRSRPSHADQLHMDLWWQGTNIVCDAGTFSYSGRGIWRNGLAHTSAHNTVIVDSSDQMKMVSRFTWADWAKGKVLRQGEKLWQGEHNGYIRLPDPVTHKRTVMKLENDRWLVVDHLSGRQPHHYTLHWLLNDFGVQECVGPVGSRAHGLLLTWSDGKPSDPRVLVQMGLTEGNENFSTVRADPNSTRGWRSEYYGHKEPAISVMLEARQPQACFWTFFGLESDLVEAQGKTLRLRSPGIDLSIDLDTPGPNTPP